MFISLIRLPDTYIHDSFPQAKREAPDTVSGDGKWSGFACEVIMDLIKESD